MHTKKPNRKMEDRWMNEDGSGKVSSLPLSSLTLVWILHSPSSVLKVIYLNGRKSVSGLWVFPPDFSNGDNAHSQTDAHVFPVMALQ